VFGDSAFSETAFSATLLAGWAAVPIPGTQNYNNAANGRILLESGFPNILLQEGGFPPISILLEGLDDTTVWSVITTGTASWTPVVT
jgi:hypothetical protein